MGFRIKLEQEKGMKERDVRDAIERSAARARAIEQQQGGKDRGQEAARREMEKHAEKDRQKGKI